VASIGLKEASRSGGIVVHCRFVAQPKTQPAATIVRNAAARVRAVERSERILIHSLARTRAGVTGRTRTGTGTGTTVDGVVGSVVRMVLMLRS
jgi:hypothetical protein